MSSLRREALRWYKILQRTKNEVFSGDFRTISAARQRIREEFVKNKDIKDEKQIKEKIQIAKDVDVELRRSVVQAVRKQPTLFEARITPDTRKMDNVMFDPDAELPPPRSKKCSDKKS
ncbi:complex III assembly factor LYRM7 [Anopheles arabiensis]|uniref:Complex III assembly factor LYRM7 n=5 Tax=gambiae species complex TaxID=44542 RepID=Q7PTD0_ANOGA|nr:complex III assembly factor LYRM7 [Anopheles arabiensis]XP_040227026.1 complex III assembly factor LYRM7 [Anopheles coluzzii]XP_041768306.1 complex III assembly factor LYRM7 [Anopheles merus]XP_308878.1 complex III assembly factor LYRM7 isoform X2 [Anopheles gambiae]EAA04084.2 AGAP006878-PA [Anopheles gambiae str. PEST]